MKPRLLDLCCKAGGATRGYQLADYHVTGVDIDPQPHYIGDAFFQADAIEFLCEHGNEYDLIHVSPPCQRYSKITPVAHKSLYPDMIAEFRSYLQVLGKPYIIENVEDARRLLVKPVMLCGS